MEYSTCRERGTKKKSESPTQWLERPTGVRKVMGSISVGDSDFFFVPRSRHVEYSIFSYFFSELKIHHLSLFSPIGHFDITDPSSMQDACHYELSKYDLCSPRVSH